MIVIKRGDEVTFRLRLSTNKPNSDGTIYTKEAAQKIYEDFKKRDGLVVSIPICEQEYLRVINISKIFELKLIEENGELYIVGSGFMSYKTPDLKEDHTIYEFYVENGCNEEYL